VSAYNTLKALVGWKVLPETPTKIALDNSLYAVCIFRDDDLLATGRIIGDGYVYFHIQDVIVHPEHQGQGVGTLIMDKLEAFIKQHALPGSMIGLMCALGKEGFYEKYGYHLRPNEQEGAGMMKYFTSKS
jgi:GNAT superfamily N-acetyltransferase